MKYTIQEKEAFSVIGQEVELTKFQNKNIEISKRFWQKFNVSLKQSYLSQSGNWIKYVFMEKRDEKLFYYCAIPKKVFVPEGFISKEISPHRYLVVEHVGSINNIYRTYEEIYKNILPNEKYVVINEDFMHFEKYDYRFHWNKANSVIEIWIPIQS